MTLPYEMVDVALTLDGKPFAKSTLVSLVVVPSKFDAGYARLDVYPGISVDNLAGGELHVSARIGSATARVQPVFRGWVVSVGPRSVNQPILVGTDWVIEMRAYDWLFSRQLGGPPSPLEMIELLLANDRLRYLNLVTIFLLDRAGDTEPFYHIRSLRRVLELTPGGYKQNSAAFNGELKALLREGRAEQAMFMQALQLRHSKLIDGQKWERDHTVAYVYIGDGWGGQLKE